MQLHGFQQNGYFQITYNIITAFLLKDENTSITNSLFLIHLEQLGNLVLNGTAAHKQPRTRSVGMEELTDVTAYILISKMHC